jgi:hypothetical protein
VLFLLLRVVDFLFLISDPMGISGMTIAGVTASLLWSTTLLVAVWRRREWARVVLVVLLLAAGVVFLVLLSDVHRGDGKFFTAFCGAAAVCGGGAIWLFYSRDVRRLASHMS